MPLSDTLKTIQWSLIIVKLIPWIHSTNFNISWSSQDMLFLDCSWVPDICDDDFDAFGDILKLFLLYDLEF